MIYTSIINFTSIDDISNNISSYKENFINNGILVFRDANLSHDDHIRLHDILGDSFGSYREPNPQGYTEDHSRMTDDLKKETGSDDLILDWHIEHPHYENPIVLGSWNMHLFRAEEESGKTYFIDTANLFDIMPDNFKEFSKKCLIINPVGESQGVSGEHNLIDKHWITDDLVIRISHLNENGSNYQKLHLFDNRVPTQEEQDVYNDIMKWIQGQLSNNLDIRIVHKWKQGDIVVPDMYKMCHSVSGGFKSEDRKFTGIWGRKYKDDNRKV